MSALDWERIRHMTLDQIVTAVKLSGSAGKLHGFTTPEGYPFRLMVAVGVPGSERVIEIVDGACAEIGQLASFTLRADREAPR